MKRSLPTDDIKPTVASSSYIAERTSYKAIEQSSATPDEPSAFTVAKSTGTLLFASTILPSFLSQTSALTDLPTSSPDALTNVPTSSDYNITMETTSLNLITSLKISDDISLAMSHQVSSSKPMLSTSYSMERSLKQFSIRAKLDLQFSDDLTDESSAAFKNLSTMLNNQVRKLTEIHI